MPEARSEDARSSDSDRSSRARPLADEQQPAVHGRAAFGGRRRN